MVLPASSGWACPASCCGDGSQGRRRAPSAELGEELAEVAGEEVGGVVGGPVAAAVELAPGDDVGVVAVGEAAQGPEVVGEAGQPHGDGGGLGGVGGVVVLVVEAGRRGGGVGQPVDGHIGQEVVGAEGVAEQLAAPGELAGGGVGQGVGDGLGWAAWSLSWTARSTNPWRKARWPSSSAVRPSSSAGSPVGKEKSWVTWTPRTWSGSTRPWRGATMAPASLPWAP